MVSLGPQNDDRIQVSKSRLNSLRAAVLGANDGIVSVASIILGVAGATSNRTTIFTAGMAGLAAGALSMAVGEYVSVSSQRDSERAFITDEKRQLENHPAEEFEELTSMYEAKGLSSRTAHQVARELTNRDAIKAHLEVEMNLNETDLSNPLQAAIASLAAFAVGGIIPLATVVAASQSTHLIATVVAVLLALSITGYISATVGRAPRLKAMARVILGGAIAMLLTYAIGHAFKGIVG
ncbi:MAG: VIT1/CCC1 transporter family protein [Candidatus Saccharimonadales bacterium]